MSSDRNAARVRIARSGLTTAAVERVSRTSLGGLPITLVDRARAALARFFSDGSWTVEDDAALSALVGPGEGWTQDELAPGIRLAFGWRGGNFKVDVEADADAGGGTDEAPANGLPVHDRTLGDTFEEFVVIESGRSAAEVRFVTGPGTTGGRGTFTRAEQGTSAAVAALFREFSMVNEVRIENGVVAITVDDPFQWNENLLQVFDQVTSGFVPPRSPLQDRQYERALTEIASLDATNPRDLARILDATTSPDAAYRRCAVAMLEAADPLVVQKPWTRSLQDSSRAVRRAAIRAMAHVARGDLRDMFERALNDKDACVRYYGLRGIAQIGVGRTDNYVQARTRDDDLRVRYAAHAALENRVPQ